MLSQIGRRQGGPAPRREAAPRPPARGETRVGPPRRLPRTPIGPAPSGVATSREGHTSSRARAGRPPRRGAPASPESARRVPRARRSPSPDRQWQRVRLGIAPQRVGQLRQRLVRHGQDGPGPRAHQRRQELAAVGQLSSPGRSGIEVGHENRLVGVLLTIDVLQGTVQCLGPVGRRERRSEAEPALLRGCAAPWPADRRAASRLALGDRQPPSAHSGAVTAPRNT